MSSLKPERGKNTRFYYYCLYRSKNTDIFQHSPKRCGQRRLWNACLQLWDEVVPSHSVMSTGPLVNLQFFRNFAREYLGGVRWKSLSEERKRYESNLWSSMECLCSKQKSLTAPLEIQFYPISIQYLGLTFLLPTREKESENILLQVSAGWMQSCRGHCRGTLPWPGGY